MTTAIVIVSLVVFLIIKEMTGLFNSKACRCVGTIMIFPITGLTLFFVFLLYQVIAAYLPGG